MLWLFCAKSPKLKRNEATCKRPIIKSKWVCKTYLRIHKPSINKSEASEASEALVWIKSEVLINNKSEASEASEALVL